MTDLLEYAAENPQTASDIVKYGLAAAGGAAFGTWESLLQDRGADYGPEHTRRPNHSPDKETTLEDEAPGYLVGGSAAAALESVQEGLSSVVSRHLQDSDLLESAGEASMSFLIFQGTRYGARLKE